jgi:uncharacterized protein YqjF (DUF2071 family)
VQEHRPWPLPRGPWVMGQTWTDLLFAHWRVEEAALRAVVPADLPLDRFDGGTWVGITPFAVRGLHPRGMPPPPVVSRFPELNVRTYVSLRGRPGIYFFSLDAGSALAVGAARALYRLPYFRARMRIDAADAGVGYRSERPQAAFSAGYEPAGPVFHAAPDTLEHWMTERYCLYTLHRGSVLRAEIHHPPWPLQPARAQIAVNTMAPVELAGAPHLLFARRQDVLIWPPWRA